MRAYMGYAGSGMAHEGACLIFAHDIREAKKLARPVLEEWEALEEFTELRVEWLKNKDWIFKEGDPAKLASDEAHVIESPTTCKDCEQWGGSSLDEAGRCEDCAKDYSTNQSPVKSCLEGK
jgi:hypothetical protein